MSYCFRHFAGLRQEFDGLQYLRIVRDKNALRSYDTIRRDCDVVTYLSPDEFTLTLKLRISELVQVFL